MKRTITLLLLSISLFTANAIDSLPFNYSEINGESSIYYSQNNHENEKNIPKIFAAEKTIIVSMLEDKPAIITVYNLYGKIVETISTQSNATIISIEKRGLYLVEVNKFVQKVYVK